MNIPPFFNIQKQKVGDVVTVVAIDYTLDPLDLDPTADFRLFTTTLTIPAGSFSLTSRNLTIYARQINCPADAAAVIDTSGASYQTPVLPINPPKADSGTTAGDYGREGISGGATPDATAQSGGNGGGIHIYASAIAGKLHLVANGGQGQVGQDGQAGGDGIQGGPGHDAVINRVQHDRHHLDGWAITPATQGGDGGHAGNGGDAGKSGSGGNAGEVVVKTITPLEAGQITAETTSGKAGAAARPGLKGTLGAAGIGGLIAEEYQTGGHFNEPIWRLSNRRQSGAVAGADAHDGASATAAPDGASTQLSASTISDASGLLIIDECFLSQLVLEMTVAEIAYLETDFTAARDHYLWISNLTSSATGTTGLAGEFAGLYQQAKALLSQLGQGLDYFGNPLNYVPVVTLDYYQTQLDGMLVTGNQIETMFNSYTAYLQDQNHNFTDMQHAVDQANDVITVWQSQLTDLYKQITGLVPVTDGLSDALASQFSVLINVNATFRKAAEAKANGCHFGNLLALLKTIVSVGSDVYGLFTAKTFKDAATPIKDFLDMGINIEQGKVIQWPDPITVPDISVAWASINPNGGPDVGDSQKLVLKQEEFDKAVQPYLDMPEADDYKVQVNDYIGLAQSRSAKLIEYTNALVQYKTVSAKIARKQLEVKRIQANIAAQNIPGLIVYRNFLFSLYQDFKGLCLQYLYQENRAFIYWSQTPSPFKIVDDSFIGLDVFHSNLKAAIIKQINVYSQPSQPIDDVKYTLRATGSNARPEQFENFRTSNSLSFQITPDSSMFLGWSNVLLTNFQIFIPDVVMPTTGNLYIRLWHHGRVFVVNPDGVQSDFTHNQVLSIYEYTIANGAPVKVAGGSLGGDGPGSNQKRIALSPFAAFTIELPAEFNRGLQLDKVNELDIHFSGYAVPRSIFFERYA